MKWETRALGEIATLLPARSISLAGDAEVKNATSACLSVFGFRPEGIKAGRMWKKDVPDALIQDGEILVARSNTPELVGNVARYRGPSGGIVASDLLMRLLPNAEVEGDYLTAHLSALFHQGYWRERAGGASGTMKKITRGQIATLKVPLPTLAEQQQISARLRAQLAQVDNAREALRSQLEAAQKLSAAQLNEFFTESSNEWTEIQMREAATLLNGRAYSQHELLAKGTPVIRIQNLNGGSLWYYSNLELPPNKYCDEGDLLFAWSASFGPYIWSGPKAIYHYHIWKVLPKNGFDKGFLFYLLQWITARIRAESHGMAMLHMTKEGMENWKIKCPSLSEQRRISGKLAVLELPIQKLISDLRGRLEAVENLPSALLRETFSPSSPL